MYLDLNKLPKPIIDNVGYDEVRIFESESSASTVITTRILDVESIEQLPPIILYETQDDGMGRLIACQYAPVSYAAALVHGGQQSQVVTPEDDPENNSEPWLISDTDIECYIVYYEYGRVVLLPSSAQFGLVQGK